MTHVLPETVFAVIMHHLVWYIGVVKCRLQAEVWQAMSSCTPLGEQQLELGSPHSAQCAAEDQPQKHHLQAALDRSAIMPGQAL